MLIIIEGIDRTGKSTLAERLRTFTGGEVMHFSKPTAHPIAEYVAPFANFNPVAETAILDRSHVGESVWPYVFGRLSQMNGATRRWVSMFFMSRGAVLLHAQRPVTMETAHEFEEAGEPITAFADIRYAEILFRDAVADSGLPVYPYEHGGWPGAALHDAARRAVVAGELRDITPRYVGSHAPKVLIVSGWEERAMPLMPYEDTGGAVLMEELDDWKQCGLVNARRPDRTGDEPLQVLWRALGKPRIMAFGGAADTVYSMGIPHDAYGPLRDFRRMPPGNLRELIRRHL